MRFRNTKPATNPGKLRKCRTSSKEGTTFCYRARGLTPKARPSSDGSVTINLALNPPRRRALQKMQTLAPGGVARWLLQTRFGFDAEDERDIDVLRDRFTSFADAEPDPRFTKWARSRPHPRGDDTQTRNSSVRKSGKPLSSRAATQASWLRARSRWGDREDATELRDRQKSAERRACERSPQLDSFLQSYRLLQRIALKPRGPS
jgi:hypothetical protein